MPVNRTRTATQWKKNAFSVAVMLGFFAMANTSRSDTGSSVPPIVTNTPAIGNVPRNATDAGATSPKNSSVVFKMQKRTVKKPLNCGNSVLCADQQGTVRYLRPQRSVVSSKGVTISANNKKQAAKVGVKVPF